MTYESNSLSTRSTYVSIVTQRFTVTELNIVEFTNSIWNFPIHLDLYFNFPKIYQSPI